ncbi:MAG: pyridoxal-phosphate dependent enzyme [Myxococcales bacterium]|nr:pyridoxal-phosphate dependent enzyme [Myxococcales bacterium]
MSDALDLGDVREAARRIAGRVRKTPVLHLDALDAISGVELYLKAENMQRIGAFKARGAMHAVGLLTVVERARGVVTFSSGNHAQAVALAARAFGTKAYIVMPTDAPEVKVRGVAALGGEITFAGTTSDERRDAAIVLAEATGARMIPPFDDANVVLGQATATLELCEEVFERTGARLDAVVVPVGGGGLVAGACIVASAYGARVFGIEPDTSDALAQSLAAGHRVTIAPSNTIADGLKPVQVGELNFALARAHRVTSVRVSDAQIGRAFSTLLLHAKTLVEPSGATGAAAVFERMLPPECRRVGVILSGGNVSSDAVRALLASHHAHALPAEISVDALDP